MVNQVYKTFMDLSIFEQIFDQIGKANKILIALPKTLTADNTASALGLFLFLQKMNKEVEIASAGTAPESLKFLPHLETIQSSLPTSSSMVISVDISQKPVDEISYEPQGNKLNIFLKSKTQDYTAADVSFYSDKASYQVIILLDCSSLESLGELFEHNAETFFSSPKINIDNKAGNEYFGAINLVDINASSVSEILSDLFAAYEKQLIDADIATCLLTGIITKTNSFQHSQTTPKAFLKASDLVEMGGRQQEVVRFLYKTKPLPLLRLWGRALARLKTTDSVLYSSLGLSDFEKAGAGEPELPAVLAELQENISNYKIVALITERQEGGVKLFIAAHPEAEVEKLSSFLGVVLDPKNPAGTFKTYEALMEKDSLATAEEKFVQATKAS